MEKYILSIDQGTTSSRAILFDHNGKLVAKAQQEVECFFPHSGWVESDALSIWLSVINVINQVMVTHNINVDNIDSIGITNQRETTVIWDKATGMPVYNAIVWQSKQTADICEALSDKKDFIHERTGLLINPYFSASKIKFILDHIPDGYKRAKNGELCFGTIDSWLIYKMTNGKVHATDVTNASRTMLYNIYDMKWDKDLCDIFGIPMNILPKVYPCSHNFGTLACYNSNVKIAGVAGDQQAALFGQTCFDEGESKNTYGTGCFMLYNTGDKPVLSKKGLLTTVAWQIGNKVTYALEGSVFAGGTVVHWLRTEMDFFDNSAESEKYALKVKDTNGVYLVPAFVGLGTPYWDDKARGSVFGLTRGTNKAHFVRAALESIAYQCKDVFEVIKKETHGSVKSLKVDGGVTANKFLMQFQSDILSTPVLLPTCLETTALGVAYLAGLCTGYFADIKEIKKIHSYQATFEPSMSKSEIKIKYDGWKKAVKATRVFE